jgi:hypothetical protein
VPEADKKEGPGAARGGAQERKAHSVQGKHRASTWHRNSVQSVAEAELFVLSLKQNFFVPKFAEGLPGCSKAPRTLIGTSGTL